ncbi:hypothetical protein NYO98_10595 [Nocardioides sp. STR2]|uniref:DUF222 domain-containing protein n=1 Tax=Nocardioides pini TaxID=2975053 RepID=A0ABT4CCP4_9ACTN|nr:hypothetical protein [Nocardioides pini]MCY4726727.1 hypothetical protein [Nocardioides pini]
MNAAEAAAALGIASSFDRRTVGEADAQAWGAALADIRLADARDAIVAHYRETREWIMPADIIRRVRVIRRERLVGVTPPTPPAVLADQPRREQRWQQAARTALADGATEDQAIAHACGVLGVDVPPPLPGPNPGRLRALMAGKATTNGGTDG